MYVFARLLLACLLIPLGQRKRKERERVLAYVEYLRDLMSVLGESRGRRNKEEARLGARRVILASQLEF